MAQEKGCHLYLRYELSGRPYFWQSNCASMKGQLEEEQRGQEASQTHFPRDKLHLPASFLALKFFVALLREMKSSALAWWENKICNTKRNSAWKNRRKPISLGFDSELINKRTRSNEKLSAATAFISRLDRESEKNFSFYTFFLIF